MIKSLSLTLALSFLISHALAGPNSLYCPQRHGYVNVGMSPEQVIAACGQPLSRQESSQPIVQRVPVQQLIYNNKGTEEAFYGVWAIPTGVGGGARLVINVVDNKVRSVNIDGTSSNAFTICNGANIEVGDPVEKVYGACGNPSVVNNSFINQPIQSNKRPEIWLYQTDQFQPPVNLTFVNGKLQSID